MYYRVYDLTADPFRSTRASYFHKSIGGYHGAKLRRYNEVIERHLSRNNMRVLNMLNTKYFIVPVQGGEPAARINPGALGNTWFVKSYRLVETADEEINALYDFDPESEAIIHKQWASQLEGFKFEKDTTAFIQLTSYEPNQLKFNFHSSVDQLTVFSDIYYEKGWKVTIDGKEADYFRANYILRAMIIPSGTHEIIFRFDPATYHTGRTLTAVSSILLLLISLGVFGWKLKDFTLNQKKD